MDEFFMGVIALGVLAAMFFGPTALDKAREHLFGNSYSLYVSSSGPEKDKQRVASFNSDGGDGFNKEKCEMSARALSGFSAYAPRYWCEKS